MGFPQFLHFLGRRHGAFYFTDGDSSLMLRKNLAPVKSHESISPDDLSFVVHHTDSVGVAVKADA